MATAAPRPQARYRKIYSLIWSDEKFCSLDPYGKLIALYCLTCPQSNRLGLYKFSPGMAEEEIGNLPETSSDTLPDTFPQRFAGVVKSMEWEWDSQFRVLFIPAWWRWNHPENVNVFKGSLVDLKEIPKSPLIEKFMLHDEHLTTTCKDALADAFSERFGEIPDTLPDTLPQTPPNSGNREQGAVNRDSFRKPSLAPGEDFLDGVNGDLQIANPPKDQKRQKPLLSIPTNLETPEFLKVWNDEYLPHLLEKHKRLPPQNTLQMQLSELATFGPERAIELMREAIKKFYACFLSKVNTNGKPGSTGPRKAKRFTA